MCMRFNSFQLQKYTTENSDARKIGYGLLWVGIMKELS